MNDRVLYVDDDPNILAACQRSLGRKLNITTLTNGIEGLELLRKEGPFAVILTDMRMPEIDGLEFLCAARKISPGTICMMLTGNADQETAMNAVNRGQIFRFLTKPCPQEVLHDALKSAIEQHRLISSEKELLQGTLTGSIKALSEVLGLVSPKAFARGGRIKPIVSAMVANLKLEHAWQYEIAAMLSQVGCIVLPPETIDKVFAGEELSSEEEAMYLAHPASGARLLAHIPRLDQCSKMIGEQFGRFDTMEAPDPGASGGAVALGAQMIRVATGFEALHCQGLARPVVIAKLREAGSEYNPGLVDIIETIPIPGIDDGNRRTVVELRVLEIRVGMITHEDIVTTTGSLLVPKGNEITLSLVTRLKNFSSGVGIKEPIKILTLEQPGARAA
jgi:response regulator RpfG family c-di-GMP phosphodiesterase